MGKRRGQAPPDKRAARKGKGSIALRVRCVLRNSEHQLADGAHTQASAVLQPASFSLTANHTSSTGIEGGRTVKST